MNIKLILALVAIFLSGPIAADDELNADEVKALFTNKTFDIHNVIKNRKLKGYDSEDGKHIVYIPWKDKTSNRKWWQQGNMHCASHPKKEDYCKILKHVGDGVYHGFTDGEHTHTLSNFRDGNKL